MRKLFTICCGFLIALSAFAQEPELTETEKLNQRVETIESSIKKQQKLKVSGYIQTQYQWGQEAASLKVGGANENSKEPFNRFGIRRGRIKFTYDATPLMSGVFQLDITEKGVGFKDAYLNIKDPWVNTIQFKAGIFDRPFGNEISYSSSKRESPERSTAFQTLFPDERDLGAMLVLQPAKTSQWNFLKLEAGLFAGNGIKPESDNRRDLISHLSANKKFSDIEIGGGISYYRGSVYQSTSKVYTMDGNKFIENDNAINKGEFAKREYLGVDFQFTIITDAGMTQLRAEYLMGQQPGTAGSSKSPNWTSLPTGVKKDEATGTMVPNSADYTYIRPFSGWYVIFIQDLGALPLSLVAKYDLYNPNTKVSGDEIGQNGTSKTDLSISTLGFGALWRINSALRLQAFYEMPRNEKSANVAGFEKTRKANVFTLRLQYKF